MTYSQPDQALLEALRSNLDEMLDSLDERETATRAFFEAMDAYGTTPSAVVLIGALFRGTSAAIRDLEARVIALEEAAGIEAQTE